jgi:parallel beta-helix repeat protein
MLKLTDFFKIRQPSQKRKEAAMKKNIYVSIVLVLFSIFIVVATGSAVCVNPPSNLVSWWPGDGNAFDVIGPNDGTLMNGATFAPGKVGQAFSFDGVDDAVAASGTNFDDLQQLTIDAWVKHNSLPAGQIMIYVGLLGKAWLRYDGANGPQQLHFYLIIDGVLEHIRVNNVLQVGVFHHVAGTYDGSVMRLYLDGAEVGSLVVSGTVEVGVGVVFSSADESLDGLLDEVEIYNCDLSASQIEAIYVGAFGDTIHVPGDYPTIQAAIDAASGGDTVSVADGTYTGPGNKDLDFLLKAITVQSENGPNNCIIDIEGSGRGFNFWRGEGNDSVVSGFTITNSQTGQNAIDIFGSSPTIENCVITGNGFSGIQCGNANPIITDCTITGNTAEYGGGIHLVNSSPTITD